MSGILELTVATADGSQMINIYVEDTETLENFKALIEANVGHCLFSSFF
jgi:hypothetical protein